MATAGLPVGPAAAAELSMVPETVIGGSGHAGLYGWGVTALPDGDVLVGDYWNFRVLRFGADGEAKGTFVADRGFAAGQHQAPYGLATDPRNGDVYLADTDRYQILKYDSSGKLLGYWGSQGSGPGKFRYPSRVAVASDGTVYVADTWDNVITVHTPDGQEIGQFGAFGTGPGQFKQPHGMAFDGQDRLFVVDTNNHRVQVLERSGTTLQYLSAFGSKGTSPGQFAGDMRGLAVNKDKGFVYVVDGEGNKVHKFTTAGEWLVTRGRNGDALGEFHDGGREVAVAADGKVWVGDMPSFRVQVFDEDLQPLAAYPDPAEPPPLGGFNQPRGAAVDAAGNIFVSDTYNFRLQRRDAVSGEWTEWGRRGRADYEFNYTRLIATDPRDGSVVVADTDNHRVKKYDNRGTFLWQVGGLGAKALQFRNPHGVDVGPDGTIYVTDTNNDRVQVLDENGGHVLTFGASGTGDGQFTFPRGITVDDANGEIWVADSGRDVLQRFDSSGAYLGKVGTKGTADDQLDAPFDLQVYGDLVIVADTSRHKVKAFTKDGSFVGAYGGRGTKLGQLVKPEGLDIVGDRLYVTDTENERIQKWRLSTTADTEAPQVAFTAPVSGTVLPRLPVLFSGTAEDDVALASVRMSVRDSATGRWWDGSAWATKVVHHAATLSGAGSTSGEWSWTLDLGQLVEAGGGGRYAVRAQALDASGKLSTFATSVHRVP